MQQGICSNSNETALQPPVDKFPAAVRHLFISPVFIIFLVVSQAFIAITSSTMFLELDHISLPFISMTDVLNGNPWMRLALINLLVAIFTGSMALIGYIIVMICVSVKHFGKGCQVGFYLIKIPKFGQNILTMFTAFLAGFKIIGDLSGLYPDQIRTSAQLTYALLLIGSMVLVAAIAIFLILFSFKALVTVSIMKESICTVTPITSQYIFTAIGCFIIGAAVISAQFYIGFNLTCTLGSIAAVLFGINCIRFRKTMVQLEDQE